uniref:Reticulon n=1 Tax=Oryzias latipes TaxID=8090 RepID=A0A3P9HC70_ORYLA
MADSEEQHVSSTTPLFNDEVHHYQAEPEPEPEPEPKQEHFSLDDIVDLVGGAQDALERHMAEDSGPQELTQTSVEEPVTLSEPVVHLPEPEVKEPEPEAKEPEPVIKEAEPGAKEPLLLQQTEPEVKEPEPVIREPEPLVKEPEPPRAAPDSTSFTFVAPEPSVVPPKAEPESSSLAPEPQAEPAPESDALPAAEPRKAAPAPAEAAERTAVTHHPPAPTSDVPPASKAQPPLLMQFPTVVDLLYWRDVKTTGVVFGAALLLLLSLTMCSIVSVCSYIGLALLSVTICFRIYKGILQAIQKSDEGHPFKQYLDQEVALSEEMVHKYSDVALSKLNKTIGELRRVFLVEDLVDSIKFAVLMWILTYVGAFFNGLTLIILGLIAAFTCPIVYEKHQAQIDHYVALVNNQVKDVVGKIQAKVPGMKRKAE